MSSTEPSRGTAGRHAAPYVRQRPAHRSVEPIDDLAQEPDDAGYVTHDSDFTVPGGAISGRAYLHYGQYLEIPKGRRDIFASRERRTRIKTAVALFVVLAVLAVVVFFVWEYMQANWGSTAR